ncbi:hypothetical protein TrRE_jg50 [Triparma retinervis]|uniref:Uncharacterized protein n=1 Tax=Triparma retinervis TaxID=2557542 RepID=A0A9W7L375_9STRA|nr:hypothetical protein TrRE_jg50 [Triparma retinervis]
MKRGIEDTFTVNEFDYNIDFARMTTKAQTMDWFENVLIPNLLPQTDYNGNALSLKEQGFVAVTNKRLGTARLRAVKVQADSCDVPAALQGTITECYANLKSSTESKADFKGNYTVDTGPAVRRGTFLWDVPYAESNDGWYSPATKMSYGGGGQTINFDNSYSNVTEVWQKVKDFNFLDDTTRAVFFQANFYNANVDLVGAVKFSIEFVASGAVITSSQIKCLPLIRPVRILLGDGASSYDALVFFSELAFYGMVLMYGLDEFRIMKGMGRKAYLKNFWCCLDSLSLFLFVVVMILRFLSLTFIGSVYDDFQKEDTFLDLDWVVYFAGQVDNVNSFNAVLTFLKLFKFVRENARMSQLIDTIKVASIDMLSILVIIVIVASGYGIAFHIAFGHAVDEYRDFTESLFTLFLATLGDFDMDELRSYNQVLGAFLFVSFIVLMFFIIVSMFLAIVDSAYEAVREEIALSHGDHVNTDPLTLDLIRLISAPKVISDSIYYVFVGDKGGNIAPSEAEIEKRRALEAKKAAEEEAKKQLSPEALERQAKLKVEHDFKKLYDEAMERVKKLTDTQEVLQNVLNQISNNMIVPEEGEKGEKEDEKEEFYGELPEIDDGEGKEKRGSGGGE